MVQDASSALVGLISGSKVGDYCPGSVQRSGRKSPSLQPIGERFVEARDLTEQKNRAGGRKYPALRFFKHPDQSLGCQNLRPLHGRKGGCGSGRSALFRSGRLSGKKPDIRLRLKEAELCRTGCPSERDPFGSLPVCEAGRNPDLQYMHHQPAEKTEENADWALQESAPSVPRNFPLWLPEILKAGLQRKLPSAASGNPSLRRLLSAYLHLVKNS